MPILTAHYYATAILSPENPGIGLGKTGRMQLQPATLFLH